MKTLAAMGLLAASSAAMAQQVVEVEKAQVRTEAQVPKNDGEEARTRKQLEEARERLDKAAREVAELSGKLGAQVRNEVHIIEGGPRRAVLGIQIDDDPAGKGVRVLSVSPGGPAAEAGLRQQDIIIALDGDALPGSGAHRALIERMRKVRPEQKVKVRVLRDGKQQDYGVVARPVSMEDRLFTMRPPQVGAFSAGPVQGPLMHQFHFWPGEFAGLELAKITPKLGAYFGASEGVLVVSAPKESTFKLEDGDVLQAIDGRKPDDGPHALRILRSYKSGEKLALTVLRQRKPVTLAVTMPERPEMGDIMWPAPAPVGAPAAPPPPAPPGTRAEPDLRELPGPGTSN